jgi:NAD+ diphosphatase
LSEAPADRGPAFVFAPSCHPPEARRDALWIYFRGGDVWLADDVRILHEPTDALGAAPERPLYLGTLDGRPCFAADIAGVVPGAQPVGLRAAFLALRPELFGVLATAAQLVHFEQTRRFCSRCAGPLVDSGTDRAKRCPACPADYYPHVAPCSIVLVHDGDRVLLTRAAGRPFWALVAGFLEPGETLEDCAAREVREETGIAIDDISYFGSQAWPFPSQIMVAFRARYAGGDIVVDSGELEDARWFALDALPPLPPPLSIGRRMLDAHRAALGR